MIDQQKVYNGNISRTSSTLPSDPGDPNGNYMLKTVYDKNNNGVVDDSEALGGTKASVFVYHLKNFHNPHKVTKSQVGLGNVQNISPEDMPISDEVQDALDNKEKYLGLPSKNLQVLTSTLSGYRGWMSLPDIQNVQWGNIYGLLYEQTDLQNALDEKMDKIQEDDYFLKTEHINYSDGTIDAGSPIVLNADGKVDSSMLSITTLYHVGPHDPSAGTEYPDTTGETYGASWDITALSNPDNPGGNPEIYTFTGGDLSGKSVKQGDFIVYGKTAWSIISISFDPTMYYKLDGSDSITGPFAGGGQKLTNIADGTQADHGSTVGQVYDAIDASLNIGIFGRRTKTIRK